MSERQGCNPGLFRLGAPVPSEWQLVTITHDHTLFISWLACNLLNPLKCHAPSWEQISSVFCPEVSYLFIYAPLSPPCSWANLPRLSVFTRIPLFWPLSASCFMLIGHQIFYWQVVFRISTQIFFLNAKKQMTVFSHIVLRTWNVLVLLGVDKIIWNILFKWHLRVYPI